MEQTKLTLRSPILVEKSEPDPLTPPVMLTAEDLSHLLNVLDKLFAPVNNCRSSMLQSMSELREEPARSKEQLIIEVSKSKSSPDSSRNDNRNQQSQRPSARRTCTDQKHPRGETTIGEANS